MERHYQNLKASAKRRRIDFEITLEDFKAIWADVCPVFGTPFDKTGARYHPTGRSFDRLDNSKGYVKGNVLCISMRANGLKKDATIEELRALLFWLEANQPK